MTLTSNVLKYDGLSHSWELFHTQPSDFVIQVRGSYYYQSLPTTPSIPTCQNQHLVQWSEVQGRAATGTRGEQRLISRPEP